MANDETILQPLCACFGHPVAGNPSQYMMERAFAHHDLDWRYLTLDITPDDLPAAINGMKAMRFRGASVATPHKFEVVQYLDDLSETAKLIGAVNCIRREETRLIGENTDGTGFMRLLQSVQDPAGISAVILGAGGAARAIAVELARAGCKQIEIVNRSRVRGEELVELLNANFARPTEAKTEVVESPLSASEDPSANPEAASKESQAEATAAGETDAPGSDVPTEQPEGEQEPSVSVTPFATFMEWSDEYDIPAGTQLLVNATSVGLFDMKSRVPVAEDTFEGVPLVADVIFNPAQTRFLDEARSHGCQILGGLGMLVYQGAIAFEMWTGVKPDIEAMQDALEEFFGV